MAEPPAPPLGRLPAKRDLESIWTQFTADSLARSFNTIAGKDCSDSFRHPRHTYCGSSVRVNLETTIVANEQQKSILGSPPESMHESVEVTKDGTSDVRRQKSLPIMHLLPPIALSADVDILTLTDPPSSKSTTPSKQHASAVFPTALDHGALNAPSEQDPNKDSHTLSSDSHLLSSPSPKPSHARTRSRSPPMEVRHFNYPSAVTKDKAFPTLSTHAFPFGQEQFTQRIAELTALERSTIRKENMKSGRSADDDGPMQVTVHIPTALVPPSTPRGRKKEDVHSARRHALRPTLLPHVLNAERPATTRPGTTSAPPLLHARLGSEGPLSDRPSLDHPSSERPSSERPSSERHCGRAVGGSPLPPPPAATLTRAAYSDRHLDRRMTEQQCATALVASVLARTRAGHAELGSLLATMASLTRIADVRSGDGGRTTTAMASERVGSGSSAQSAQSGPSPPGSPTPPGALPPRATETRQTRRGRATAVPRVNNLTLPAISTLRLSPDWY